MHIRLIPHYILWHYTLGIKDYFSVARRFLVAVAAVFSLRLMFKTFFDPFERLGEHYNGGVSGFFETFIVNMLMRMVGMVVRFCVICIGITAWFCAAVFCIAGIVVWMLAPLIVLTLLYISLHNLFSIS